LVQSTEKEDPMDPVPELKEPKAGPGVSYSPVLDVEDLIRCGPAPT